MSVPPIPQLTIRAAELTDALALSALWNPIIRDTGITFNSAEKTPDDVADYIRARQDLGHAVLVADMGGRSMGFASYAQFRGGVGYAKTMEHTILLAPAARGQGVGRALMHALEAHAVAAGVHSFFAGVSAANPAGIAFHQRLGYAQRCILPQVGYKFGRYFDLVLMQKFLTTTD